MPFLGLDPIHNPRAMRRIRAAATSRDGNAFQRGDRAPPSLRRGLARPYSARKKKCGPSAVSRDRDGSDVVESGGARASPDPGPPPGIAGSSTRTNVSATSDPVESAQTTSPSRRPPGGRRSRMCRPVRRYARMWRRIPAPCRSGRCDYLCLRRALVLLAAVGLARLIWTARHPEGIREAGPLRRRRQAGWH